MTRPSFVVVLPARWGSTRFPGKPLAVVAGRPLLEWVWRRAVRIPGARGVHVATDDARIAEAARAFGADVVMTRADHATGTERVGEAARRVARDVDVVVNLQGDEPVFDPALVVALVERLGTDPGSDVATAAHAIEDPETFTREHVVKVVCDAAGHALYFSRAPIPAGAWSAARGTALRHVGIYAFRREALERFCSLAPTPLERAERLEQLRALESGMRIAVEITSRPTVGVDVPDDVKTVERLLRDDVD